MSNRKLGSIALARQLCYEIAGATSEDDMDGGGYSSVDVAEILSAEVVRLQEALAQRTWVGLTRDEQSFVYSSLHNATSREDSFWVDFANAIEDRLKEKNT